MNISINLIVALSLCVLSGDFDHNGIVDFKDFVIFADNWLKVVDDGGDSFDQNDVKSVTIALTNLEVTDKYLELGWTIKNGYDHDVWVCHSVGVPGIRDFETYIAKDAKTLVIRRRFNLPMARGVISEIPISSRYVRLNGREERTESLLLPLPVPIQRFFEAEVADGFHVARNAESIALEIGFYDEDLPGLILHIVEVAEKLNCAELVLGVLDWDDVEILKQYFGGLYVRKAFNSNANLRESIKEGSDRVYIPYMGPILKGERILRMTVDGVSIACK